MNSVDLNWLAIVIATIVAFVGGSIWYSPILFAPAFQRHMGVTDASMREGFVTALIGQAIVTLIEATVLAAIISWAGAGNLVEGASVGLIVGAGLLAVDYFKLVLFERRAVELYLIGTGYTVIAFLLMGAVIGAMR